jgi:O-antigen/teichoic acid export membrane protein
LAARLTLNFAAQLGTRLVAALVGLVTVSSVSRYLDTETYGVFTVLLSLQAVLCSAAEFGLGPTTLRMLGPQRDSSIGLGSVIGSAALLRASTSVLALLGGAGFVALTPALRSQPVAALLVLSSVSVVALLSSLFGSALQFQLRVDLQNLGATAGTLAWLGGVLAATRGASGLNGLMLAFLLSAGVGGLVTFALFFGRGGRLHGPRRGVVRAMVRETVPLGMAAIISGLYFRIDTFLLLTMSGQTSVAIYGGAFKLTEQSLVLATLLNASLLPLLVRAVGTSAFASAATRGALAFLATGSAIGVTLFFFGPWLIVLLFPPSFADSIQLVQGLACVVPLVFVNTALNASLMARGRAPTILKMNVCALVLALSIGALLIARLGPTGAVISLGMREMFITCTALWLSRPDFVLGRHENRAVA